MKSTGLFGKNSGRVGGVVYSTYRGEQIVRAYQPKVNNPSTKKQVEQRAKFKLVSQVAASLGREIKMSFIPNVQKESNRNAFVKEMLKKTIYSNSQASLPIEDLVLTNSRQNVFIDFVVTSSLITGVLVPDLTEAAKVRIVYLGYNSGGEIKCIAGIDVVPRYDENEETYVFQTPAPAIQGYTNIRALAYVYEPNTEGIDYEDYEVLGEEATLSDVIRVFGGRVNFYATQNVLVPQNV